MNRRFLIAWLVLFVAWYVGSFIVHGLLLHADYEQLAGLFRQPDEAKPYFPLMVVAHLLMAGAFVWIYARGVEAKPWPGQGLRYGLAIAALMIVPLYLVYFVVQPMPGMTVLKQIVYETILVLLLGLLAAYMYRHPG
jgi:predicted benzoate:H+ symporter BenE